jgi:nicotinate-nucleotide--dimethylbenzimidazole phosphoribosyltransferase
MSLLDETRAGVRPLDEQSRSQARARLERLTMPHWALGRLMDLAEELAAMTGSMAPPVARKTIVTMAGDHGVVAEGVSAYPQEVTVQMVANILAGGAGINALAKVAGARVVMVDMGVAGDLSGLPRGGSGGDSGGDSGVAFISKRVGPGTRNMARGPAMTGEEAVRSIEAGIEVAQALGDSTDLFGTGEMGIGNTTPSSAIVALLAGVSPAEVTGRGTGLDDAGLKTKVEQIEKVLSVNRPDSRDGLDVLAKIGGFEIGGIAGVILGAASMRKPVVVDGFVSTAGALIAQCLCPSCADYMVAAHLSVECGHAAALRLLGKKPLLDLGLRLGEGTGAALAMNLVQAAANLLTDVASFEEAAVSQANA